jgi:hypothetical protein
VRIQPKVVDAGHHSRRLMRLTGLDTEENQARRLLNDMDTFRVKTNQRDVDESVVAHEWLTECFEPVVNAIPEDLRGKRDPAQVFHEVLDYRWYQSQNEHRYVRMREAVQGYINDVLRALPDEAVSPDGMVAIDQSKQLANPSDPSMGYLDDVTEELPPDPWEANAEEVDLSTTCFLDRNALLKKKKKS